MLNINTIRKNSEEIIQRLKIRNFDGENIINELLNIDKQRKQAQAENDRLLAEQKQISKTIGELFKSGNKEEGNKAREKTAELKNKIQENTRKVKDLDHKQTALLSEIPNIPHKTVPPGKSDQDNEEIFRHGDIIPPKVKKPHWDIIRELNIIDFDLGTKITGAGFPVYKGKAAKLLRALISFFLDEGEKAGYLEVLPPLLVNEDSGFGTGQLPDKDGQMYQLKEDNYFLIPTAEVPVTNIFRNEILKAEQLPEKRMAYTPCFRREAGSWGSHVRGLNRLHQFDKVEIVRIEQPDFSYEALEDMKKHVSNLLQKLNLPYRIMRLCGGELGFTSALTFDFEVFSAGQDKWLEVSSVSNFEDYQANRLKLRYRDPETNKPRTAHTLNGSALALPRIMAAIIENNFTGDAIIIPHVLHHYTGFKTIDKL
ncbi:MAG: serine--tRNA ligase [Bacteroidales bacterium]